MDSTVKVSVHRLCLCRRLFEEVLPDGNGTQFTLRVKADIAHYSFNNENESNGKVIT